MSHVKRIPTDLIGDQTSNKAHHLTDDYDDDLCSVQSTCTS
jgi:hypothetical protein